MSVALCARAKFIVLLCRWRLRREFLSLSPFARLLVFSHQLKYAKHEIHFCKILKPRVARNTSTIFWLNMPLTYLHPGVSSSSNCNRNAWMPEWCSMLSSFWPAQISLSNFCYTTLGWAWPGEEESEISLLERAKQTNGARNWQYISSYLHLLRFIFLFIYSLISTIVFFYEMNGSWGNICSCSSLRREFSFNPA